VTDTKSAYKNGIYPSGIEWNDYSAKWCLSAIYNTDYGWDFKE
jgi:hypothetical protein